MRKTPSSTSSATPSAEAGAAHGPSETRARLMDVLGNTADVSRALAILEYVSEARVQAVAAYSCTLAGHVFELRFKDVTHFADSEYTAVLSLSEAVLSLELALDRRRLTVRVRRDATPSDAPVGRLRYVPPATPAVRPTPLDFAAMGMADADDQAHVSAIVACVYNMYDVMPHVGTWIEMIEHRPPPVLGSTSSSSVAPEWAAARGIDIVLSALTPPTGEDASEAGQATGDAVVGYALCFTGLPPIDGAFLGYVREHYATFVTRACVWFAAGEPDDDGGVTPTLVINIRRAATSARLASVQAPHRTRGNPLHVAAGRKRARRAYCVRARFTSQKYRHRRRRRRRVPAFEWQTVVVSLHRRRRRRRRHRRRRRRRRPRRVPPPH